VSTVLSICQCAQYKIECIEIDAYFLLCYIVHTLLYCAHSYIEHKIKEDIEVDGGEDNFLDIVDDFNGMSDEDDEDVSFVSMGGVCKCVYVCASRVCLYACELVKLRARAEAG